MFYVRAALLLILFSLCSVMFLVPIGNYGVEAWRSYAKTCAMQWVLFEEQRRRFEHNLKHPPEE
jgi:hypothetical protein